MILTGVLDLMDSLDPLLGWAPAKTWDKLPYGTYPIWMFGFFSLAFDTSEQNIPKKVINMKAEHRFVGNGI